MHRHVWMSEIAGHDFVFSANVHIENCRFNSNNDHYAVVFNEYTETHAAPSNQSDGCTCTKGDSFFNAVFISGCVFRNNTKGIRMFGMKKSSSVLITNSTFNGSTSISGVARCTFDEIVLTETYIPAVRCKNVGHEEGGAIHVYSAATTTISGCNFYDHGADKESAGVINVYSTAATTRISGCNFYNNRGGSVYVYSRPPSKLATTISGCNIHNNVCRTLGAVKASSDSAIIISGCNFYDSSTSVQGGAAIFVNSWSATTILGCNFYNNSADNEGGAIQIVSTAATTISECNFYNNSADLGGGAINIYSEETTTILGCNFYNNSAGDKGGAIYIASEATTTISVCNFYNNVAGVGGAIIVYSEEANTAIIECNFHNNSAGDEGGALYIGEPQFSGARDGMVEVKLDRRKSYCNITILTSTFNNNNAITGGALYMILSADATITNSTFSSNSASIGAAMYISCNSDSLQTPSLTINDVIIKNNYCPTGRNKVTRGGALYFDQVRITVQGGQFTSNGPQGAIQGVNGDYLQLGGKVIFAYNSGENGGAISLSNNVKLSFIDYCDVTFAGNTATRFGGAIYIEETAIQVTTKSSLECALSFYEHYLINFHGNRALLSGHSIYATPIYHCKVIQKFSNSSIIAVYDGILETYLQFYNITPPPLPGDSQIVSSPTDIEICGEYHVFTYPGGTVLLNVSSMDYANSLSPSVVYAYIRVNGNTPETITLAPNQITQWVERRCIPLEYQIYGPENTSLNLFLSSYPGNPAALIEVTLKSCEPGFTLTPNFSCVCSAFLTSFGVMCDTAHGTVNRSNQYMWIGIYNDKRDNTIPIIAFTCPLNYCKHDIQPLFLTRPGDLCNGGRSGTLCGHCSDGLSVVFGSSGCMVCSDMWLLTILMFAVLGASLVVVLFILNLTVTQGTLYGLIFYANIIQANPTIFFNQSILRPLQVMISLINLDLGVPLCFYDGMDDATKMGLQFVFPTYLITLTIIIIVACHYCLCRSSDNVHYCDKINDLIGQRVVGLLSTLI